MVAISAPLNQRVRSDFLIRPGSAVIQRSVCTDAYFYVFSECVIPVVLLWPYNPDPHDSDSPSWDLGGSIIRILTSAATRCPRVQPLAPILWHPRRSQLKLYSHEMFNEICFGS